MPSIITNRLALGRQTSFATPVARTRLLRGIESVTVSPQYEDAVIEESGTTGVGSFAVLTPRTFEGAIEGATSYEEILYPLCGLFGVVTPTGSGPYTWTFNAPYLTMPSPQIYSAEFGVEGFPRLMAGMLYRSLEITSEIGALRYSADFVARDFSAIGSFTTLPVASVNPVSSVHRSLFIDTWSGTMGATAVTATLIDATLAIDTGRHLKVFDGERAGWYGDEKFDIELSLTMEYNSSSDALIASMLSGVTQRKIRLRFQDTAARQLDVDFWGTLTGVNELFSDRDGNATVELTFRATYHVADAQYLRIAVVNGVATLP